MWFLLILNNISVLPLWAGKWIYLHKLGYSTIFYKTSFGKSFGWGEVNLKRISGKLFAAISSNCPNLYPGKFLSLKVSLKPSAFWCPAAISVLEISWKLLTFCPNSVIYFTPSFCNCSISLNIVSTFLLLSLPLTKGTIQNEHILLHPLMIDKKALIELGFFLTGVISAYVYSTLNCTFIWFFSSLLLFNEV